MALDSPITPTASPRLRVGFAKPNQEQIVLLITIALLIVFSFTLNGFATVANILVLLRSISILGILGLGMGMIVISRGIDLSEVAIMAGSIAHYSHSDAAFHIGLGWDAVLRVPALSDYTTDPAAVDRPAGLSRPAHSVGAATYRGRRADRCGTSGQAAAHHAPVRGGQRFLAVR